MAKNELNIVQEKVAIMIDYMIGILNCSYSDALGVIIKTNTYKKMLAENYSTLHDSAQANLSEIGAELRDSGDPLGNYITDDNIVKYILMQRKKNVNSRLMAQHA